MMRNLLILLAGVSSLALVSGCSKAAGGGSDAGTQNGSDAGTQAGRCAPGASCKVAVPDCLGLVDNTGASSFGLRIASLSVTKPDSFTTGIVAGVVISDALPNLPSCNVMGAATMNWLLQFDTSANQLKFGGVAPVSDPTQGYGWGDAAVTMDATVGSDGSFSANSTTSVNLPVYADANNVLFSLPVNALRLTGKLSASRSCIGRLNADGLDPANQCQPDAKTPLLVDGGTLSGYIKLKDADNVQISALSESLCVLLSGTPSMYGDGGRPAKCKQDSNGNILFKGDWCSATNMAADATCADAVQLSASYGAQSVKIN